MHGCSGCSGCCGCCGWRGWRGCSGGVGVVFGCCAVFSIGLCPVQCSGAMWWAASVAQGEGDTFHAKSQHLVLQVVFCFIFSTEAILKMLGMGGLRWYFRDPSNTFDCFLVLTSLPEALAQITGSTGIPISPFSPVCHVPHPAVPFPNPAIPGPLTCPPVGSINLSMLRVLRLLRMFRALRAVRLLRSMKEIIDVVQHVLNVDVRVCFMGFCVTADVYCMPRGCTACHALAVSRCMCRPPHATS